MLPTTLVTIVGFLLKFCNSSPVYSMQPAYIIANIGTTGRNIRNLPCVSRKSNEKGVCMFAIDCLKANGTHLGTCIDRFYFGSCCHIEPMHDIVGNTIDTAIIPSRQPPSRLSTITTTTQKPSSSKIDRNTSSINMSTATTITTSISTAAAKTTTARPTSTTTTRRIGTTITPKVTITNRTKVTSKPTQVYGEKLTKMTTRSPKPTTVLQNIGQHHSETTEVPYKLTTFQTVEENTVHADTVTTRKPLKATTTSRSTTYITRPTTSKAPVAPSKPGSISTPWKPKPTTRPRPFPITSSKPIKITKPPYKPVLITTRTPTKPSKSTIKPVKITTTKKSSLVTKATPTTTTLRTTIGTSTASTTETPVATTVAKRPSTAESRKPLTTTTSKPTTSIRTKQPLITKPPVTTEKIAFTATTTRTVATTSVNVSTTQSNELPLVSSVLEAVNGNPATNEIEQVKPLQPPPTTEESSRPSLVTWAVVNEESTSKPTTLSQEWMPITTPDGWVLLPSLSTTLPSVTTTTTTTTSTTTTSASATTTNTALNNITETATTEGAVKHNETSSQRPLESSSTTSTITTAPFNYSTEATNSTVGNSTTMSVTEALTVVSSTITNLIDASSTTEQSGVNMSDFTDVCGRRMYPEARIVGGQSATFGKWPWQISLRQWRTSTYLHKCGAALLNENWAITAAHCVDNVPPSDLLLRLGEHDLSTDNEPYIHQERRVQIVASHPQFDPRTFEYDLALLRFYEPVQFKPNIIPVCVPDMDENFVGRTAYVTGWGRLYEDGPLPSVLQEVSVPVINNTVCESMYRSAGYIEHIPHIFICAGWRRGGFDSCEGDSGGPMVIQRPDKRFLLAGIISWGIGCAEPNQPGVYTRISEFRDWINQILQF